LPVYGRKRVTKVSVRREALEIELVQASSMKATRELFDAWLRQWFPNVTPSVKIRTSARIVLYLYAREAAALCGYFQTQNVPGAGDALVAVNKWLADRE
jgi:hypothetical protein